MESAKVNLKWKNLLISFVFLYVPSHNFGIFITLSNACSKVPIRTGCNHLLRWSRLVLSKSSSVTLISNAVFSIPKDSISSRSSYLEGEILFSFIRKIHCLTHAFCSQMALFFEDEMRRSKSVMLPFKRVKRKAIKCVFWKQSFV